jgi:hypothetical protein
MEQIQEGTLLWKPSADVIANANITLYRHWLYHHRVGVA